MRRRALLLAAASGTAARAETPWRPSRPIRVVLSFPPGASSDVVTRLAAPGMEAALGQALVIESRPGAGGAIGLEAVARAPADGHTLGVVALGALVLGPLLAGGGQGPDGRLPAGPVVAPVSLLAEIPFLLVAAPDLPAATLADALALARARPGALAIGHGGQATAMHLSAEVFGQMAGVVLNPVPFRGSAPAALAALGNQVGLAVVDVPAALELVRAGRLRALGVTSARRLAILPEVPTIAEAGLPGYDSVGWFGLVAPAGTPPPTIDALQAAVQASLGDPALVARIRDTGCEPRPTSAAGFAAFIAAENARWGAVIRRAGIRLE